MSKLNAAQLGNQAGVEADRVSELVRHGILPPEGPYHLRHVTRILLAAQIERLGVSLDSVGRAIADGDLSLDFVDEMLLRPMARADVRSGS